MILNRVIPFRENTWNSHFEIISSYSYVQKYTCGINPGKDQLMIISYDSVKHPPPHYGGNLLVTGELYYEDSVICGPVTVATCDYNDGTRSHETSSACLCNEVVCNAYTGLICNGTKKGSCSHTSVLCNHSAIHTNKKDTFGDYLYQTGTKNNQSCICGEIYFKTKE